MPEFCVEMGPEIADGRAVYLHCTWGWCLSYGICARMTAFMDTQLDTLNVRVAVGRRTSELRSQGLSTRRPPADRGVTT